MSLETMQDAVASTSVAPITSPSEALKRLRDTYPVFAQFQPLKIGIQNDLREAGWTVDHWIKAALQRHVSDSRYLVNVAKGGERFALDGSPAGEVTPQQCLHAANLRATGAKPKPFAKSYGMKPSLKQFPLPMKSNLFKLATVITDFSNHLDIDSVGMKTVSIKVTSTDGVTLSADLNAKSFRKAQAAFRTLGGQAAVVLNGNLDMEKKHLNDAGISVMPKSPGKKEAAPEAVDTPQAA